MVRQHSYPNVPFENRDSDHYGSGRMMRGGSWGSVAYVARSVRFRGPTPIFGVLQEAHLKASLQKRGTFPKCSKCGPSGKALPGKGCQSGVGLGLRDTCQGRIKLFAGLDLESLAADLLAADHEPIHDYAFDCHTLKGKRKGKTKADFFREEQNALEPFLPGLFDDLAGS